MAKISAPLLSFDGGGTVAKSVTYARWRGIPYARRYAVPGNPRTAAQQLTRGIFSMLNQLYLYAPPQMTLAWDTYATGRGFLGRNRFIGDNVKALRGTPPKTTMADFIASPGARGGLPPAAVSLNATAGTITATIAVPETPEGWTLKAASAVAFLDQAPDEAFVGPLLFERETLDPTEIVFTGLDDDAAYVVSVWLEWTKPNGQDAFSISTTLTASTPA